MSFGKYTLLGKLASGGMADIYLAIENAAFGCRRFVAIKRMRPALATDPDHRDYFISEGRIALAVAHPNLPHAYELASMGGTYYLAMEYMRGTTLLNLLCAAADKSRLLSLRAVMKVAMSVAAALDHLHAMRDVDGEPMCIVHRDVTPQNIVVGGDGAVKLIDFGISQSSVQAHAKTENGVVRGKFSYLAPEQISQRDRVDHRADLFSFGVAIHEALSGRSLFRGASDRQTLDAILRKPIPPPSAFRPDVPSELDDVVLRALARAPEQRYQRAYDLLLDLELVADKHRLHPATTRLRSELESLCGQLGELRLAVADASVVAGDKPATGTSANDSTKESANSSEDEFDSLPTVFADQRPGQPPERAGRAIDQDLIYFLRRAGTALPRRSSARPLSLAQSDQPALRRLATRRD